MKVWSLRIIRARSGDVCDFRGFFNESIYILLPLSPVLLVFPKPTACPEEACRQKVLASEPCVLLIIYAY